MQIKTLIILLIVLMGTYFLVGCAVGEVELDDNRTQEVFREGPK